MDGRFRLRTDMGFDIGFLLLSPAEVLGWVHVLWAYPKILIVAQTAEAEEVRRAVQGLQPSGWIYSPKLAWNLKRSPDPFWGPMFALAECTDANRSMLCGCYVSVVKSAAGTW